jgi:hypothetical protein
MPSIVLDSTVIMLCFLVESCDSTVTIVEAASSTLSSLLKFIGPLATISRLLLHTKESKQVHTGGIRNGTTSILVLFLPDGRHTIKEGLMQLILSEREISAR